MTTKRAPHFPILVVDDEEHVLAGLSRALTSAGMDNILTCQNSRDVMGILSSQDIEVLLLDLTMPNISGQELLPRIREGYPELPVIIITGVSEVDVAVECMRQGVFDYLVKAVEPSKLIATVSRAVRIRELSRENDSLRHHLVEGKLEHPEHFSEIITEAPGMRALFLYIESIAISSQTVLITGETGTGKELVARAIHTASGRGGSLVAVNIAGLDESMFADTLFGHAKGAFTGAEQTRGGLIEGASAGSLFLDEIGDLSPQSQVRLLRLLESGEYYPLGSDVPRKSDARIVVATNRDLAEEMAKGHFRKDLYYRLKTYHVHVPALRERANDTRLLADFFLEEAAKELGKQRPPLPDRAYGLLSRYSFPGNVRELRSMMFDAVSRSGRGDLLLDALEEVLRKEGGADSPPDDFAPLSIPAQFPTLKQATTFLIQTALERCQGNQARAARLLGISAPALNKRLKP